MCPTVRNLEEHLEKLGYDEEEALKNIKTHPSATIFFVDHKQLIEFIAVLAVNHPDYAYCPICLESHLDKENLNKLIQMKVEELMSTSE
jgi:hypothetical protein